MSNFLLNKSEAKIEMAKLVNGFKENIEQYKSGAYKEAQVRKEFIDRFFEILGWDIGNDKHLPEQFKEVIHEDSLKIGGKIKAPDYGFRIFNAQGSVSFDQQELEKIRKLGRYVI